MPYFFRFLLMYISFECLYILFFIILEICRYLILEWSEDSTEDIWSRENILEELVENDKFINDASKNDDSNINSKN